MAGDILVLDDVVKEFGSLEAVAGLSLTVEEDEVLSIIGPNGAGKTTTFNLITGRYEPTSGTITLADQVLNGMEPNEIVQKGLVRSFQITQLFTGLTVLENVRLATQQRLEDVGWSYFTSRYTDHDEPLSAAYDILEQIEMTDIAEKPVRNLSHGEQRRLELGVALACDPSVLCMDEPTAGMSSAETVEMTDLIADIATDMTVVIVEHDMDVVMQISDRVAVMHRGNLLAIASPESIRENQLVQEVYLGETGI